MSFTKYVTLIKVNNFIIFDWETKLVYLITSNQYSYLVYLLHVESHHENKIILKMVALALPLSKLNGNCKIILSLILPIGYKHCYI